MFQFNVLRPRKNGHGYTITQMAILEQLSWIKMVIIFIYQFIRIPLKIDPMYPIRNKSARVQIKAWHRIGDEPSFEGMMA